MLWFKNNYRRNLQITDFLDVTFSLKNEKYYPLRKPNNDPLYISALSNHPKNIIKEISNMIGKRISEILCDKHEFEKAKGGYNKALEKSGFREKIKYHKQGPVNRVRTRKVIWFKAPYSSHVKTNVGKTFMKLIVKHFLKNHRYYKIFNKNTIKLSYSCMQNMRNEITKHNNKLLFLNFEQTTRMRYCRDKASCPMDRNCLQKCFVYQAQVDSTNSRKSYLGSSEDEFKTRYNNHTMSFRDKGYEKETELPKYVWYLKDKGEDFTIK